MPTDQSETTGWQPIGTAPQDGTEIDGWVLFNEGGGRGVHGYRETAIRWNQGWVRKIRDGDYVGEDEEVEWSVDTHVKPEKRHLWASELDRSWKVTHWMPIPEPPLASKLFGSIKMVVRILLTTLGHPIIR